MSGGDAAALLKARLDGGSYPVEGVPDTPRNRDLWEKIGRDIENLPPGVTPDMPNDWSEMPGE